MRHWRVGDRRERYRVQTRSSKPAASQTVPPGHRGLWLLAKDSGARSGNDHAVEINDRRPTAVIC